MENIYTFVGKDENFNIEQIEAKIRELNIFDASIIKFDGDEEKIEALLEELNTVSFFVQNKIVILYHSSFLYKSEGLDQFSVKRFLSYLNKPSETSFLFISLTSLDDVDQAFKDSLTNNSIITKTEMIDASQFFEYTKNSFKKAGYDIFDADIKEIIARSGEDYYMLNNNISKLMIYKFDSKNITSADINALIIRPLDDNVFNLVEAVISHNKIKSYEIYQDLLASNVDNSLILGSLIFKFREMAITKRLVNDKMSKKEIAEVLNIKEGRAYYMMKDVANFDLDEIEKKLNMLIDYDYQAKMGKIDLGNSLVSFLLI
ncbi:MAG: DNA polymerase III subunit delta [Acholeplasmatales bacterium]|nr:DNA polymerase III subunit delta [Acholeplasmatales bacterium]